MEERTPLDLSSRLEKKPSLQNFREELHFLHGEMGEHMQGSERVKENREATGRLVKEYIKLPEEKLLADSHRLDNQKREQIALNLAPEKHDPVIEELLGIMQEHGIYNTLKTVSQMNNPHIEDDVHRFLVQYLLAGYEIPGLKPKDDLRKALGMTLFEVTLPSGNENEKKPFKEIIFLMEQFLAGMQSVSTSPNNIEKNYYALEIALSEASDDIVFYVSIPTNRVDLFEKQISGLYDGVRVVEVPNDYNIFSYSGAEAGAYATAEVNEIFEIRTYDEFENDPIAVILNSFSKMAKEGEGAALQIVCAPAGDTYIKKYGIILEQLKKGENVKEAMKRLGGDFGGALFNEAASFLSLGDKKDEAEEDKKIDENAIQSLTSKLGSTIMQVNLRLLVSARDAVRAKNILQDLKSSFHQFRDTKGNGISFREVSGNDLKKLFRNFSFRLFDDREALRLNLREVATLYHFSNDSKIIPQLKHTRASIAPAPSNMPEEGIILGKNTFRDRVTRVHFAPADRLRHFYIIGQTGTGKTYFMRSMIRQDIMNGEGVCFIDPHGSDIEEILSYIPEHRAKDVIYFDPADTTRPMGLNMLEYDTRYPEQKSFVINELLSIFNKLFDMKVAGGPQFEQYFRNSAGLVMEHPESGNTLIEIGRVLSDKNFRDLKLSHSRNPIINQFWANAEKTTGEQALSNFVPYITSKFDSFISNEIMRPVIAQSQSSFDFRNIMDNRKILLVNLSKGRLGELNSSLIGLVLVGKILMAALSRAGSFGENLPPFYLYIDEFQNVTTDSITQILSEARKYGLSLTIAHQFIAQLPESIRDAVFGNVGSMAAFRVGIDDAQYLESRFSPIFMAKDFVKLENYNAYVQLLANGSPLSPFNIETMRMTDGNKELAQKIKELSQHTYGRDRAEVERDIMERYGKTT